MINTIGAVLLFNGTVNAQMVENVIEHGTYSADYQGIYMDCRI